jgi:hypothetical protein
VAAPSAAAPLAVEPLVLVPEVPPLPAATPDLPAPGPAASPLAHRRELREKNSELARDLVFATGKTHAEVNAELNRRAGIKRISEASVKQLEHRLEAARGWLTRR